MVDRLSVELVQRIADYVSAAYREDSLDIWARHLNCLERDRQTADHFALQEMIDIFHRTERGDPGLHEKCPCNDCDGRPESEQFRRDYINEIGHESDDMVLNRDR
jgi:hypothetical protein